MEGSSKVLLDESFDDGNLEELKEQWTLEQLKLSKQVSQVLHTDKTHFRSVIQVDESPVNVNLFGGLDISFIEGDPVNACACYVVIDKELKVDVKC